MLKKYKERKGDGVHIAKVQDNLCKHHHSKLYNLWKGKTKNEKQVDILISENQVLQILAIS